MDYNHADDIVKFLQAERSARSATIASLRLELEMRSGELTQMEAELVALNKSLQSFGSLTPPTTDSGTPTALLEVPRTEEENSR